MGDKWVDLDPDKITSDICMRCGMCCKTTWVQSRYTRDGTDREPYLNAMFDDRPESEVSIAGGNVYVCNWCSHLKVTSKHENLNVHVYNVQKGMRSKDKSIKCDIYDDAPKMCTKYNCFLEANGRKRLPEYYNHISNLIVDRESEVREDEDNENYGKHGG